MTASGLSIIRPKLANKCVGIFFGGIHGINAENGNRLCRMQCCMHIHTQCIVYNLYIAHCNCEYR